MPIHVYGYGLRYLFAPRFSDDVLKGSDKWNEGLRQFVNFAGPDGKLVSADQQMADQIARDPTMLPLTAAEARAQWQSWIRSYGMRIGAPTRTG
jgi:hypothetical protein